MGVPADQDVRVALVAGATRGAGRAIAVELARAGMFHGEGIARFR
jgi:NAD(P)-dependent dehydrogenase (short-subunit alcohol dehydrogenase family)